MKIFFSISLFLIAAPAFAQWQEVLDAEAFRAHVVDGTFQDNIGNSIQFNRDGSLTGQSAGRDLSGSWEFRNGFACFDRRLGDERLPSDCVLVLVDGSKLVTVRNEGKGRQTQYTRQ